MVGGVEVYLRKSRKHRWTKGNNYSLYYVRGIILFTSKLFPKQEAIAHSSGITVEAHNNFHGV